MDDYRVWRANFGAAYSLGLGTTLGSTGTIPEPSGTFLMTFVFLSWVVRCRDTTASK